MMDDTSPLGKSVEEIERDAGNLDPTRHPGDEGGEDGAVIIPPTGLGGASGTATGAGFPLMPTGDGDGRAAEREDG